MLFIVDKGISLSFFEAPFLRTCTLFLYEFSHLLPLQWLAEKPEKVQWFSLNGLIKAGQPTLFGTSKKRKSPQEFLSVFLFSNEPISSAVSSLLAENGYLTTIGLKKKKAPKGLYLIQETHTKGLYFSCYATKKKAPKPGWWKLIETTAPVKQAKTNADSVSFKLNDIFASQRQPLKTGRTEVLTATSHPKLAQKVTHWLSIASAFQQKAKNTIEPVHTDEFPLLWSASLKTNLLKSEVPAFSEAKLMTLATDCYTQVWWYAEPFMIDEPTHDLDWNSVCWVWNPARPELAPEVCPTFPHPIRKWPSGTFIFPFSHKNGISMVKATLVAKLKRWFFPDAETGAPEKIMISDKVLLQEKELIKLTKGLPVLHKYSLRIFDLLPRHEGSILLDDGEKIRAELTALQGKVKQISIGANERKRLLEKVAETATGFSGLLDQASAELLLQKEAIKAINPASVYFYLYALAMANALVTAPDVNETTVVFNQDFWKISKLGKDLFEVSLQPLAAKLPFTLQTQASEKETDLKVSFKKKTLFLPGGIEILNLPDAFWEFKVGENKVAQAWVELQKNNTQPTIKLDSLLTEVAAIAANAVLYQELLEKLLPLVRIPSFSKL